MSISTAEKNEYFSKLTSEQVDFVDAFGNIPKPKMIKVLSLLLKGLLRKGETEKARITSNLYRKLRDTKADFDFTDFDDLSVVVQNMDLLQDLVATVVFNAPKVSKGSRANEIPSAIRR